MGHKRQRTMKATQFFPKLKKVAKDCTMHIGFNYSIDKNRNFYFIHLNSEPTEKVIALCEKNGFSINRNTCHEVVDGQCVAHIVWELLPNDLSEIEFTSEEVFKNINDKVIIATDTAMNESGLFQCTPTGDILIWTYEWNIVWKKWQWGPYIKVRRSPLSENIVDENGRVIEYKSTHKIDNFYFAPIFDIFDFHKYLENLGVTISEL